MSVEFHVFTWDSNCHTPMLADFLLHDIDNAVRHHLCDPRHYGHTTVQCYSPKKATKFADTDGCSKAVGSTDRLGMASPGQLHVFTFDSPIFYRTVYSNIRAVHL